ncbi:MAG TPA: VOC family protein [Acidimicrobiales bacterium]|nr:VOC family protein [Acidimicrobiales bacterium]
MSERSAPAGYHNVNPFVIVEGAQQMMGFLGDVFGAVECERITRGDGTIGNAELAVGDSVVMVTDATGALPARPSAFYVFVPDVDDAFARAVAAGGQPRTEPTDQFYGNREAGVVDRWGNIWWIATPIEEVPASELQARYEAQL